MSAQQILELRAAMQGWQRTLRRLPPDSPRRPSLEQAVDRFRRRIEILAKRLAPPDADGDIGRIAPAVEMIKTLPDRVEAYDARLRPLGSFPPESAERLRQRIAATGRYRQGLHPAYRGGRSTEPGIAEWWRKEA